MKEGLHKLYALQQLDDKIGEMELSLKQIPEIKKKLEHERDSKAIIIQKTKEKLNENVKERESLEKEILLVKEKIKKYKDQMSKATTNKEYQGFISEIKYEEENIAGIEEKVIEKMLESDEIMNEIRESEIEFNKISEEYNKKISDLKEVLDTNKSRLTEVQAKKSGLRSEIVSNLLRIYDTLAKKKYGKAVSLVETEFCGTCNVGIRPQRVNELISCQKMFTCDSCGRILVYRKIEKEEDIKKPKKRKTKNDD